MTKCQQYFVTDPSRSVDFQRQETDPEPDTRSEVTVAMETMRKVEFTSSKGTEDQPSTSSSDVKVVSNE